MIENKCDHIWKKHTDAGLREEVGQIPAFYRCQKCSSQMTAAEVFQLEALENQNQALGHLKGFQKWVAVITVVVSLLALIVSVVALVKPK